jgi:hypothetical protein
VNDCSGTTAACSSLGFRAAAFSSFRCPQLQRAPSLDAILDLCFRLLYLPRGEGQMKNISVRNIAVLFTLELAIFLCGMAYEHYTSRSAIEELRASVGPCLPVAPQLRADAR